MKKIILLALLLNGFYYLHAQCNNGNLPVIDSFDTDEIGVCWQVDDMDGDNNNWIWWGYSSYYGGYKVIASYSYYTSTGALTPDNWIISYPIDLTSFSNGDNIQLSYKIRSASSNYAHEFYSIYAATGNQTSDFEASTLNRGEYVDNIGGAGNFVTRTLDLSSLAGNTVYIAFRHYNSTDQSNIEIDEVNVSSVALGLSIEDFDKSNFSYQYSSDRKTLTLESANKPISQVEIYNILGQRVIDTRLSNTKQEIDLSTLVNGIYIAQIEIDNTKKTIKFLKQ